METSTLVLTALATLNEALLNDDGFHGYSGEQDEVRCLLGDLYDLVYSHGDPLPTPDLLVAAWYDQFYAEHPDLLCDG